MSGPELVAFMVLIGGLTGVVGIVARAVVRYQEGRLRAHGAGQDPALRAELEELRAQLVEHQDMRQRLFELEERMDFTERMLVSAKREQVGPGGAAEQ
jgi:predicted secreted Zn-dependent protease